jgi:predicted metal-dependent phosphoesterase TrpH
MIHAAIEHGLDAMVFTDHDHLMAPARLETLNERYAPLKIWGSIEISLEREHVIVLGVQDQALEIARRTSHLTHWDYPDLYTFVRKRGGLIILCHPFRYHPDVLIDVEQYPPDAIEVHSRNTPAGAEDQIRDLAKKLGAQLLSNSDAHHEQDIGNYYNRLAHNPQTMPGIISALRDGKFTLFRK